MSAEPQIIDDRELLLAFVRDGSDRAFGELVGRHLPAVFSAALRRVNGERALAEDVTQQVFVKALADRGRRLDHIWVSRALKDGISDFRITRDARGWERPSDHVPVTVTLEV